MLLIGITNLVLAAKGKVFNYVLRLIGVLMYALISYQNHVYGQITFSNIFLVPYTVLRLV
ncbi:MAG: nicotinamide mononucleotide transporter [Francisella endosymbiont of Hyalomma scupense]